MGTWIAIKSLIPLLIHLFVSVDTASAPCFYLENCAKRFGYLKRYDPFPIERHSRQTCRFINEYKKCNKERSERCLDARVVTREEGNLHLQNYLCMPGTLKDIEESPCYVKDTYIYLQQQLGKCLKFPNWREQKKPRRCKVRAQQLNCTLSIVTQICGWKVALHVKKRNEIIDYYDNVGKTCLGNKICWPKGFQCESNRCIHRKYVCDEQRKCRHGEDERHCGGTATTPLTSTTKKVTTPLTSTTKKVKTPLTSTTKKVKTPRTSTTNKVTTPPTSTTKKGKIPRTSTTKKVTTPPTSTTKKVTTPPTSTTKKVTTSPTSTTNKVTTPPTLETNGETVLSTPTGGPCYGLETCAKRNGFLSTRDDPFPIERNSRKICKFKNKYRDCVDNEFMDCPDRSVLNREEGNLLLQNYLCMPKTLKDIEESPCYEKDTYIYLQQQLRECLKFSNWREIKLPQRCGARTEHLNCTLSIVTRICGWKVALHVKKRNQIIDRYDNSRDICIGLCEHREFKCQYSRCIHRKYVCNKFRNCLHGDDERHCGDAMNISLTSTTKKVTAQPTSTTNIVTTTSTSTTNKVKTSPTSTTNMVTTVSSLETNEETVLSTPTGQETTVIPEEDMAQRLLSSAQQMMERLDSIENRMEERLDSIENKIEGRLDSIENRMEERLDSIDNKMEERLDSIENKLEERLDSIDNKMEERLDSIENRMKPTYPVCYRNATIKYISNCCAFCNVKIDESDDAGWIVIQRRTIGDQSFNRSWEDYKKGFGTYAGDFWRGNDAISSLTSKGVYELRIEVKVNGVDLFAHYTSFKLQDQSDNYRLILGSHSGTLDSIGAEGGLGRNNHEQFSTFDRDNDGFATGSCAQVHSGGWWYQNCLSTSLNGLWRDRSEKGMLWLTGKEQLDLSCSEMKIQRKH